MLLNPLATRRQLAMTASMAHGVTHQLELELRALGCQLIQQIGMLLRLPQRTMAVAQVFFQRFWFTSSMCDFSANQIVLGCVLLSTKLEDTRVDVRHLVYAFYFVQYRVETARASSSSSSSEGYEAPGWDSDEMSGWRERVVVAEMQVLKRLGFDVQVVLPYGLLVNYLQVLGLAHGEVKIQLNPHAYRPNQDSRWRLGSSECISLAQAAWSFVNDALQTPILCIFSPHIVACAAITLAAQMGTPKVELPQSPAPWWSLFDASQVEIKIAMSYILWRYHHTTSITHAIELLDRQAVRHYIERGLRTHSNRSNVQHGSNRTCM